MTVAWKEPFTAFEATQSQDTLASELKHVDARQAVALSSDQGRRIAAERDVGLRTERRIRYLAQTLNADTLPKKPLGRLKIKRLGLNAVFVQGSESSSLELGPAHYTETSLPGEPGTVGIAGHRTTYGAWFRHIDDLKKGDRITLTMPYGQFVYTVQGHRIVPSDRKHAFNGVGYDRLVLSACHPLFSATNRILVNAKDRPARPGPRGREARARAGSAGKPTAAGEETQEGEARQPGPRARIEGPDGARATEAPTRPGDRLLRPEDPEGRQGLPDQAPPAAGGQGGTCHAQGVAAGGALSAGVNPWRTQRRPG